MKSGPDIFMQAGDSDLASFSTKHSQFTMCTKYNQPKEYFHEATRQTLCNGELEEKQIDMLDCVLARDFCQGIMQRYVTLLDNATYMPCEHIHKEKEYGIPWRSAFKKELYAIAEQTYRKIVTDGDFPANEDPWMFFHRVVKKDALDAATFDR